MTKKSKRQRRLLAEKEERRIKAMAKAGEPYSRHKERICFHYYALGGMAIPVYAGSYLQKIDEDKFMCMGCGKVFTAEQSDKIDAVCNYLKTAVIKSQSEIAKLLTEDIAPCRYYFTAPNETVICGTQNGIIPRVSGVWCG